MKSDLIYCMSSYLQYRTVVNQTTRFSEKITPWYYEEMEHRLPVNTAEELDAHLRSCMDEVLKKGKAALMLSSGMDSAILASYLPEGSQTYTLRCKAHSGIDETEAARYYAEKNGLRHTVIDVTWKDFEQYTVPLMQQKGYPIHSIEVQIYKACLQAKKDGIDTLIFGETADIIYGGHSKLLSRDWKLDEFVDRFSFVDLEKVMKEPVWIKDPILPYLNDDGTVDVFAFLNGFEYGVSLGFYNNACRLGQMGFHAPYSYTILGHALDLERIRRGEGKYVIRDLFCRLYPDIPIPEKTPLPRPMAEWLAGWEGPEHPLLMKDHIKEMTGDQKWYIYALDQFLCNIVENRGTEDAIFKARTN